MRGRFFVGPEFSERMDMEPEKTGKRAGAERRLGAVVSASVNVCVYEGTTTGVGGHSNSNSGGGSISWGVRERRSQAAPVRHRHLGGHPARPRQGRQRPARGD